MRINNFLVSISIGVLAFLVCILAVFLKSFYFWEVLSKCTWIPTKLRKLRISWFLLYQNNKTLLTKSPLFHIPVACKIQSSPPTWWLWIKIKINSGQKQKSWYRCWKETIVLLDSELQWTHGLKTRINHSNFLASRSFIERYWWLRRSRDKNCPMDYKSCLLNRFDPKERVASIGRPVSFEEVSVCTTNTMTEGAP